MSERDSAGSADSGIVYAIEKRIDVGEFRRVLVESGLGATRPVDDASRLQAMLDGASLIVSARLQDAEQRLVGIARGMTDRAWCCYLTELAVCKSAQRRGIGEGLLQEARRHLGPRVSVILASVPESVGFYERIGMARLPDAFVYQRAY